MPSWSDHLAAHLSQQSAISVVLTFAKLEELVGGRLPPTVYRRTYWVRRSNRQYLDKKLARSGWHVSGYDRDRGTVTFSRR